MKEEFFITDLSMSYMSSKKRMLILVMSFIVSLILVIGPFVFAINLEIFEDLKGLYQSLIALCILLLICLTDFIYTKETLDKSFIVLLKLMDDYVYMIPIILILMRLLFMNGWF